MALKLGYLSEGEGSCLPKQVATLKCILSSNDADALGGSDGCLLFDGTLIRVFEEWRTNQSN